MKTMSKRLFPVLMAIALLVAVVPFSASVAAAAPEGIVNLSSNTITWTGGNTGETGVIDWTGANTNAPAGSKLVIQFDTTDMAWKDNGGDTNCWTFYLDVWSASQNKWVQIAYAGNDKCTTIFTRNGVETTTTLDFPNCPNGWIYSFPAQATGWLIIDGLNVEINDMNAVKFRPEGGATLGSGAIGKVLTIGGFGYIPPVTSPVSSFESQLHMDGYATDGVIGSEFSGDAFRTLHGANWNLHGLTTNIPDGAKLVVKYDMSKATGSLNFYIDTTPIAENADAQWRNQNNCINFLTDATNKMVTLINDGTAWSRDDGVSDGAGCYKSDSHMGLPYGTSGYVIIDTPDGYELNDLSGFFWFRWDSPAAQTLTESFKFQIGWVAGDVAIPDFSAEPEPEPEPDPEPDPEPEPELTAPAAPFGYTKYRDNGIYYTAKSDGTTVINTSDFWTNETRNAPSGSRLAFYFDTTAMTLYKTQAEGAAAGVGSWDANCFTSHRLEVWDITANGGNGGWVDLESLVGGVESGYGTNMTTIFTRDMNGTETTLKVTGKRFCYAWGYNDWYGGASSWMFSLPSAAKGWVIFEFTDPNKVHDLTGYRFSGPTGYSQATYNKEIYFGDAGLVPPVDVAGENVTVSGTMDTVTVSTAANAEVKAGSLLVYDTNGNVIGVPTRVGKGDLSTYDNTTEFTYDMPSVNATVKAEYVDANASTPNFGSIGVRANTAKKGIRFEYRLNITREGDQYYTKLNGQKVAVDAFGALLCTQKNYNTIGAAGMTAGANTKGLYDVDFSKKLNRVDACAAYEDICLAMVNIPEKGLDSNIYSRAYIVVNGQTYYTSIRYNTYNNAAAGVSASTVA